MGAEEILASYASFLKRDRKLDPDKDELPAIPIDTLKELIAEATNHLCVLPRLLKLEAPIIVIGDIHGSIWDLLHIFQVFGPPPARKYLFLGDYVDRGCNSIEVMALIMCYLIKYPDHIYTLRGNHEFMHINHSYGFYTEILKAYNEDKVWLMFQELFSYLPLAAIVGSEIFCVHGGLSSLLQRAETLNEIRTPLLSYDAEPIISDLVWSDPRDTITGYTINQRGSGCLFGPDALTSFLSSNNLKVLIRAHQCVSDGFELFGTAAGITVFSAMNYCKTQRNRCGVIELKDDETIDCYSMDSYTQVDYEPVMRWTYKDRFLGLSRICSTSLQSLPALTHSESASAFANRRKLPVAMPRNNCSGLDDVLPNPAITHMPKCLMFSGSLKNPSPTRKVMGKTIRRFSFDPSKSGQNLL